MRSFTMTDKTDDRLKKLIEKYTSYVDCEEYHIHQNNDGIKPNADRTDGHMEFDEDAFEQAIRHLIREEQAAMLMRLEAIALEIALAGPDDEKAGVIVQKFGYKAKSWLNEELAALRQEKP
jgi:hypothetical protein